MIKWEEKVREDPKTQPCPRGIRWSERENDIFSFAQKAFTYARLRKEFFFSLLLLP